MRADLGIHQVGATIHGKFNTVDKTTPGAPITLAGSPAVKIYRADDTGTEQTTGLTLTVDFDGNTGQHHIKIVTTASAFYTPDTDFHVELSAGTVDGVSVVGVVVFRFRLRSIGSDDALASGTAAAIDNTSITLASGHGITVAGILVVLGQNLSGGGNSKGQSRLATYSGAGDKWTVDPPWNSAGESTPANDGTVVYRCYPAPPAPTTLIPAVNPTQWAGGAIPAPLVTGTPLVNAIRSSTAQAGTSGTLTLDAGASAVDDYYKGVVILWTNGANIGVQRRISGYVGATKVATFAVALPAAADATPTFLLLIERSVLPGTDGKALISADAQDLSATLDVNAKRLGGNASRPTYLDNLNIGGLVASHADATSIQLNTRVVRVVPEAIQIGIATTYRIELLIYDDQGNMAAPDSAPTIGLVNQAGTSRASRLNSTTMALVSTGYYRAVYTAAPADPAEQLVWLFTVIENGATRLYGNTTLVGEAGGGGGSVAQASGDIQMILDQLANLRLNDGLPAVKFRMRTAGTNIGSTGQTVTVQTQLDTGAFATVAGPVVELANGYYVVPILKAERAGRVLTFRATAAACDPTEATITLAA